MNFIKRKEDNKDQKHFEEKLRTLLEAGNELSRVGSVDTLCRRVVELGRARIGFDRMSIWFIDKDPDFITGSFGIDEIGQLRYEIGERVAIADDPAMRQIHADRAHSILRVNVPLRDHKGRVMGHGSHAIAAIWNGQMIIGYISTDNLLKKKPITEHDRELLELYASTFGHIYSLKLTEEELQTAYTKLKDIQYQLIQAAKMEVVGELASGVAHEVKNPLGIILGGIDYLSQRLAKDDKNVQLALQRMNDAVLRADDIVKGLLDFSKLSKLDTALKNLNEVIGESLALVKHQLDRYHIEVVKDFGSNLPQVRIDRNKIQQVFVNLFMNAIYSMPDGGQLKITTCARCPKDGPADIFVDIEDTGTGIPEDILDKIFDPFFTTRRDMGGTGLGLSIARTIINLHEGKIGIGNRKDCRGTKVTLMFKI